jgi:hypothetical protein
MNIKDAGRPSNAQLLMIQGAAINSPIPNPLTMPDPTPSTPDPAKMCRIIPAVKTAPTKAKIYGPLPAPFWRSSVIPVAAIHGFASDMYHTAPNANAAMAATITLTNSIFTPPIDATILHEMQIKSTN